MNTYHTLAEKLDSLDCRRDEKARRVTNTAPETVANITAEELEAGVSLERLESLNVPVYSYSTQITVHGKLPAFDPAARPGGYKAVFQNGNGSVGIRFAAIDAEKKALISRAARVSESGWFTHANSTGFSVVRYFMVYEEEQRAGQKAATIAALQSFPVSLFYGSAGAFSLAYGVGYGVSATIGAIPAKDLWAFISQVFGVQDEADLTARENAKATEQAAKDAVWRAECEERKVKHDAMLAANREKLGAFLAAGVAGMVKLASVPRTSGAEFVRYVIGQNATDEAFKAVSYRLQKRGPKICFSKDDVKTWKAVTDSVFRKWDDCAAAGYVWAKAANQDVPAKAPARQDQSAGKSAEIPADKDANAPASSRQTWALYCASGKDVRKLALGLTYGKAHAALSAIQGLRGDKPAAFQVVAKILGIA